MFLISISLVKKKNNQNYCEANPPGLCFHKSLQETKLVITAGDAPIA